MSVVDRGEPVCLSSTSSQSDAQLEVIALLYGPGLSGVHRSSRTDRTSASADPSFHPRRPTCCGGLPISVGPSGNRPGLIQPVQHHDLAMPGGRLRVEHHAAAGPLALGQLGRVQGRPEPVTGRSRVRPPRHRAVQRSRQRPRLPELDFTVSPPRFTGGERVLNPGDSPWPIARLANSYPHQRWKGA